MAWLSDAPRAPGRAWLRGWPWLFQGWLLIAWTLAAAGAEVEEAQRDLLFGNYSNCLRRVEKALVERPYSEELHLLKIQALWTLGRYGEARTALTNALAKESRSIRLRWLGRNVYLSAGEPASAIRMFKEVIELVSARPWSYRAPVELVVFGQAALLGGADPKQVLDRAFGQAKKGDPPVREAYLATGELALEKHDFALAATQFQEGLKRLPEDPDLHFGLAQAYEPSEPALMLAALEAALKLNSNHLGCLLKLADHSIDAEDYAAAGQFLDRVQAVNPWHPEAWAYRAVLAHLRNQPDREQSARATALRFWAANPRVDHLAGLKLSQHYRFAEGAARQRQALRFEPDYLPAKAQLAQDLLRLGEETEGWRLAEAVQARDGYDVAAANLLTLRDTLRKFETLTNAHFTVRMSPLEAALYGPRVLELLEQARAKLGAKYGLESDHPVLVEIFPAQKDFAVRTFGLPENHGFLGVCFGEVITANSPASRPGQAFNWESMLWHEFCHVLTLRLTHNKMPRWLSEGISVYEERQANPAWGQRMDPRFRELILGRELTPLSRLSSAFLAPPSELHLQFAYYESSLAAQFLAERFGLKRLTAILRDLGRGLAINQAIETNTAPLAALERDFAAFARRLAEQMGPGLDWEKPPAQVLLAGADSEAAWDAWARTRPTNFWALTRQAREGLEQKQWARARAPLEQLVKLYPNAAGPDSPYRLLAQTERALGDTNAERRVLTRLAELDAEAPEACQRLMELAADARDWPAVAQNARRYLAVNPLVPLPYRFLARAAAAQGQDKIAIDACQALLRLDPANPADLHFELAQLLHRAGDPAARRHLLQALEEAPRHRAALRLLRAMGPAGGAPTSQ
jgi:Tfp pilus assembly protein PilF